MRLKSPKYFSYVTLLALIFVATYTTVSWAQTLNVISQDPTYEIFIDGKYIANKSVFDHEVSAGSHLVRVDHGGQTVYSQTVDVDFGLTKTINVDTFVAVPDSPNRIPNRGAQDIEAQRLRKARGNIAIGAHFSSAPIGLSFKWFWNERFGTQIVGWMSQNSGGRFDSVGGRVIYNIADSLAFNKIVTFYTGVGTGTNFSSFDYPTLRRQSSEIFLGIEFPLASGQNMRAGDIGAALTSGLLQTLGGLSNSYMHLELGLEDQTVNGTPEYQGIHVSGGLHFYF